MKRFILALLLVSSTAQAEKSFAFKCDWIDGDMIFAEIVPEGATKITKTFEERGWKYMVKITDLNNRKTTNTLIVDKGFGTFTYEMTCTMASQ